MGQDDDITEIRETSPLLPCKKSNLSSSSSDSGSITTTGNSSSSSSWTSPQSRLASVALATALCNCLWAGSILIFSLYAPLFNEKLGYRQMHINAVSVAAELGMYLPVPIFGFICDRFGPNRLSLLSTFFFGPGYTLAAAAYTRGWDYKVMVAAFALIGMGTSSMYFAGVTTCAKNFTGNRGLALALPIAAFGLSSLWQAQLVSRIFTSTEGLQVEKVFEFFAFSLVIVGLVGSVGLQVSGEGEDSQLSDEEEEKSWINTDTRAFLTDRSMWWIASGVFLVMGPGEAFINNMGTLIQTLRPTPTASDTEPNVDPTLQVSLVALTSTAARLIAGSVSDYLAPPAPTVHLPPVPKTYKRMSCSRMSMLLFFAAIMFVGFFLVASGTIHNHPELFWLVSSSIGAGYGAVFCLAPTVVSVVWGTKNFGTNWGIVTITPALGALVYGCAFATEYDAGTGDAGACYGWGCVRYSFAAMAGSIVLAMAGWSWVWRGWKRLGVVI